MARYRRLSPELWPDLERLFGPRGACGGCWCMWWRLSHKEFQQEKGEGNRIAMRRLVDNGIEPGLIAYLGDEPVGWVAVAPREEYFRLDRSRILARVDEQQVWSVVCFFIAKHFRRQGVSGQLLSAACDFVKTKGAKLIEGYPIPAKQGAQPDPFIYTGLESIFKGQGRGI